MSETKQELKTADFDIKINGSDQLKQIFGSINSLVREGTFHIYEEGITFRGMDPSHVAMIDLRWHANSFEKFEVKQAGFFALRVDEICKLFKHFKKTDSVRLHTIDAENIGIETHTTKTKIRMIELSESDIPLPRLSYNSRIDMRLDDFKNSLSQINVVSDYVTFETTENQKFILTGKGDHGESELSFESGMPEITELEVKEDSMANYTLDYMRSFLKHLNVDVITIEYSQKMPVRFEVKLDNQSKLFYYLAPRVEH
jgi:proliferating cell nuclear antigen